MARGDGRGAGSAAASGVIALLRGVFGTLSAALLLAGGLAVATTAGLAALALSGERVALPAPAVAWVEARLATLLGQSGTLRLGGLDLWLGEDHLPRVALRGVALSGASGAGRADLPELEVGLLPAALLRGELRPETVRLEGASATVTRRADGSLGLAVLAGGTGGLNASGSLTDILDAVDRMLSLAPLAGIGRIEAEGLTLVFDDQTTGRAWRLVDGSLTLTQDRRETTIALSFALAAPDGGTPAQAQLWFRTAKGSPEAVLFAEVSRIDAAELAAEVPALAALGLVDAPVSAAVRGAVDARGALGAVWGRLMVGPGELRPRRDLEPVPFERAVAEFSYVPGLDRIDLAEFAVDSRVLRLRGTGWADPERSGGGAPEGLVAQLRLSEFALDPEGVFAAPLAFADGVLDLRLGLAPLTLEIGQIAARAAAPAPGAPAPGLRGRARVAAAAAGWEVAVDVAVDAIAHDRLLAAWPLGLAPATRRWLAGNVLTGTLRDVRAALRLRPGQEPVITIGGDFDGAEVRVLPRQPPIRDGAGYIVLHERAYTLVLDAGRLDPGAGGPIDVAGSVFRVPDVTLRPARAEIDLVARGSVAATLALLAAPPFGLAAPGVGTPDPGSGSVAVAGRIELPLVAKLAAPDIAFALRGEIGDLRSEGLLAGHELAADRLALSATSGGEVVIAGRARLDGVPLEGRWSRPAAPGGGAGQVAGTVELSPRFVAAFRLPVAAGSVEGAAPAAFTIDFPAGAAPRLRLTSDLAGLGLRLAEAGWSKPGPARGRLLVEGTLGRPVELARLVIEAPGLLAEGTARLAAADRPAEAEFARLRLGDWLDGRVEVASRDGAPAISVRGGTLDLRAVPAAGVAAGAGRAGRAPAPVELALDRLVISDKIALTDFRASLVSAGGLAGRFHGLLNGEVAVEGRAEPVDGRTALRVTATDGGAVLRAAGFFGRARGGALDLVLVPRRDGPGQEGRLRITGGMRVHDAPVLASLLSAISVVGLIEQLAGPGIAFSEVEADLRLTPAGIEIANGSALGPSMGVTLAGIYAAGSGRVDIQGVISPLYLLNAAGGLFSRRGEGLFGFTYRIRGEAANPRIDVNPLSVLTPGMFRDIFRAAPPRLAE